MTKRDILLLKDAIDNAAAVVKNPARNALIYLTGERAENGRYIVVAFDMNNDLHGETAHEATSIHTRESVAGLLNNLGEDATVYVRDKNRLDQMLSGIAIQSHKLLASVESLDGSIASDGQIVKEGLSGESSGAESYGRSFDDFSKDARRLPAAEDSTSYADTLREMQPPGARQSKSYADELAHVNELLQNAALSPRDQTYIQEDIADAQRRCDAAVKAIADPNATAEKRAQAVRRAIDALDYARQRIDDLGLSATQLGVSTAQDALADIAEKLKPYLSQEERSYESEIGARDGLASSHEDVYNAGSATSSADESAWQSGSSPTQMPNYSDAVTPREKFVNYSLDYENEKAAGKAEAYERALGYTKENADDLIDQIHKVITSGKVLPYATEITEYGSRYRFRIPITGPNGKTKNVIVVYQIDAGTTKPRLITNYVEGKKK